MGRHHIVLGTAVKRHCFEGAIQTMLRSSVNSRQHSCITCWLKRLIANGRNL